LGYNCYTKLYFNSKKIEKETQFFYYIGTSVWSIIDLLNNDFDGMFDKSNYYCINIAFFINNFLNYIIKFKKNTYYINGI
jgi:hypothetical protein